MSISKLPKRAAAVRGENVSNRHYVARLRCPLCGKAYAKPKLFVGHVRAHRKEV